VERVVDLQKEVFEVRKLYRRLDILSEMDKPFTTLTARKSELNLQFENFLHHAESNRQKYYRSLSSGVTCKLVTSTHLKEEEITDPTVLKKTVKQKIQTLPNFLKNAYLKELRAASSQDDILEISRAVDEELREVEGRLQACIIEME